LQSNGALYALLICQLFAQKETRVISGLALTAHAVPLTVPESVAPVLGVAQETVSGVVVEDVVGIGVGEGVGDGVGLGVAAAFCTFTLITSLRVEPSVPVTVAVMLCVPLANFVVSSMHCVPSAGVLSVLSAVASMKNTTFATLPEVLA
jgi:hypothetical protein